MDRSKKHRRAKPGPLTSGRPNWLRVGAPIAVVVAVAGIWLFWNRSAQKTLTPSPQTRNALQQIQAMHEDGKYEEAINLTRAQLAKEPEAPLLHYSLGALFMAKSDPRAAILEFEEEIRRNPRLAAGHKHLGIARAQLGEVDLAIQSLEKAVQLQPDDLDASFQLALAMVKTGRFADAVRHLLTATQSNDAKVYSELGMVYRKLDDRKRAEETLRKALDLDPKNLASMLNLGQLLVSIGEREEGEQLLNKHTELSKWFDLVNNAQRSTRLSGATPNNFLRLAKVHLQQKNHSEAEAALKRAITLDPRALEASLALAELYLDKERIDDADTWIRRSLQIDSKSSTAHFLLALKQIAANQITEAMQTLGGLRQAQFLDAEQLERLGGAYLKSGHLAESQAALKQSIAQDPGNSGAYLLLGWTFILQRRPSEARTALRKGIELEPQNAKVRMLLGIASFNLSDLTAAQLDFREAIRAQRVEIFSRDASEKMLLNFANLPESEGALRLYRQLRDQTIGPSK